MRRRTDPVEKQVSGEKNFFLRQQQRGIAVGMRHAGMIKNEFTIAQVHRYAVIEGDIGDDHRYVVQVRGKMRPLDSPVAWNLLPARQYLRPAGAVADDSRRHETMRAENMIDVVMRDQHQTHRFVGELFDRRHETFLHGIRAQGIHHHAIFRANDEPRIAEARDALWLHIGIDILADFNESGRPFEKFR